MTEIPNETRTAWAEARQHITDRFGAFARSEAWQNRRSLPAEIAVSIVETAREYERDVRPEDLRAALRLVQPARRMMDATELGLIEGAREAGMSWDEIGETLGIGDRRLAQQRYSRLKDRPA